MHPVLFEIGPLRFGSYGVVVLLAAFVGWLILPRYARREALDPHAMRSLMIWTFVGGSIGCRALNVFLRLPEVIEDPRIALWLFQQAGVWYGAVFGGLLTAAFLVRKYRLPLVPAVDAAAVPVVIGGGLGRIGCILSGCCHGTPTDLPWGIHYTNSLAHALHPNLPYERLHPTPLYELGITLVIALVLDRFGAKRRAPGQIALLWFALYGIARSFIEVFRGDAIRGTLFGPLSTSQSIGLVVAAVCLSVLVLRARSHRDAPRPADGAAGAAP